MEVDEPEDEASAAPVRTQSPRMGTWGWNADQRQAGGGHPEASAAAATDFMVPSVASDLSLLAATTLVICLCIWLPLSTVLLVLILTAARTACMLLATRLLLIDDPIVLFFLSSCFNLQLELSALLRKRFFPSCHQL